MKPRSFANRLRKFLQSRPGQEVTIDDMADALDLSFKPGSRHILNTTLGDFRKRGEVERVRPGAYRYKDRPALERSKAQKMWAVLRARRSVTVEDLQELAGAGRKYVLQWLNMLARREIVVCRGKKWVLVKDTVAMPADTDNAKRLRQMRSRQKAEALAAIDAGIRSLTDARLAVARLTADGGEND